MNLILLGGVVLSIGSLVMGFLIGGGVERARQAREIRAGLHAQLKDEVHSLAQKKRGH